MKTRIEEIRERLETTGHGPRKVQPNGEVTAGSRKVISNISSVHNESRGMGVVQVIDRSIAWDNGEKAFYENAGADIEYLLEQVRLLTQKAKAVKPRKKN